MQLPTRLVLVCAALAAAAAGASSCTRAAPAAPCECDGGPAAAAPSTAATAPEPAPAPEPEPEPLSPPVGAVESSPEAGQRLASAQLPNAANIALFSEQARIALQLTEDLFAERYTAIRQRLQPQLREELTEQRIQAIAESVMQVHGRPARVLDAWRTTAKEDGATFDAGAVLMRMERTNTRFRMLVVFDQGGVSGLWFRPI